MWLEHIEQDLNLRFSPEVEVKELSFLKHQKRLDKSFSLWAITGDKDQIFVLPKCGQGNIGDLSGGDLAEFSERRRRGHRNLEMPPGRERQWQVKNVNRVRKEKTHRKCTVVAHSLDRILKAIKKKTTLCWLGSTYLLCILSNTFLPFIYLFF